MVGSLGIKAGTNMTLLEALKINPKGFIIDKTAYYFIQYPWENTPWPRANIGHWSEHCFDIKDKSRDDFEVLTDD